MNQAVNRIKLVGLRRILNRVNRRAKKMEALSDEELSGLTEVFRAKIRKGTSLDAILPDAYAAIREAARRTLGMYPYDVQVMGAIALHQGKIAEMKTGEGKTLVASMPLYLNALTGKSCILITMNSYLANRDAQLLDRLYRYMGLRVAIGVPDDPRVQLTTEDKQEIYKADIVYTTDSALGFDYLIENLTSSVKEKYLRPFHYIIIDEADSVLLDNASTPLVISGAPKVQSNLYPMADYFVTTLEEGDYEQEEKDIWLTEEGIRKAEVFFRRGTLFSEENYELVRHIYLALKAHLIFEREHQYIVDDGKVLLLDEQNGRILANTKLRGGQHQAIEAKEHVKITQENRAMASITYQSLYNMFPKIAGMTGTGVHDAEEFRQIYGLDCVLIPTRKKRQRIDYPDRVFTSHKAQVDAAIEEAMRVHETGQPVLVIADSIDTSNYFSERLLQSQIPHNVLNAYNTAKEADIIREGGQRGAVTVATAVAGRGTDIKLGEGVEELGGLAVLGIGRMPNQRMEQQARGRAGRQGDPGYSRFYVSLEDEVVKSHGADWMEKMTEEDRELTGHRYLREILRAQKVAEEQGRGQRQMTMDYGESIKRQRNLIYETRDSLMREKSLTKQRYLEMERDVIDEFLDAQPKYVSQDVLVRYVMDHVSYVLDEFPVDYVLAGKGNVRQYLEAMADRCMERKIRQLGNPDAVTEFFRLNTLKAIDEAWIEQVDYLQQLRLTVSGRAYAQRNVMYEFHKEAYLSFERLQQKIRRETMRNVLLCELEKTPEGKLQIVFP